MDSIINLIANNPELLKSLPAKGKQFIEGLLEKSANLPEVPISFPTSVTPVDELVSESSNFFNIRYFIIFLLLVWAIALIVIQYISSDQQLKDRVTYIHNVLFGSFGILPIIGVVLLGTMLSASLIPTLTTSIPSFIDVIKNIGSTISFALLK